MFDTIKYSLTNGAASVAKAVLFLVLAIVVANLVKGLVLKLIDSTKIKEWLGILRTRKGRFVPLSPSWYICLCSFSLSPLFFQRLA